MCSHMSKVSKVETFLFSKTHFLVRDDKHEIMQVFAGFRKISGFVWSRNGYFGSRYQTLPDIFPNQAKTCTITKF